eukprot:3106523-Alexandrium_andersonii.AAC.1
MAGTTRIAHDGPAASHGREAAERSERHPYQRLSGDATVGLQVALLYHRISHSRQDIAMHSACAPASGACVTERARACLRARLLDCVLACVLACVIAPVLACAHACVRPSGHARPVCQHACFRSGVPVLVHVWAFSCACACACACLEA